MERNHHHHVIFLSLLVECPSRGDPSLCFAGKVGKVIPLYPAARYKKIDKARYHWQGTTISIDPLGKWHESTWLKIGAFTDP